MNRLLKLSWILFFAQTILSSAQVTIDDLYELARKQSPYSASDSVYKEIYNLKSGALNKAYLPELNFTGQAQYQSDVTQIELKLPFPGATIPVPPKDQYNVALNINQLIWDGGAVSAQKEVERISANIGSSESETQINAVKEKINEAFFGILELKLRRSSLSRIKSDLEEKSRIVKVMVVNGVVLERDLLKIEAEIKKVEQNMLELDALIETSYDVLKELTGADLKKDSLVPPAYKKPESIIVERQEFVTMELNKDKLEAQKSLIDSRLAPKFFAYGKGAYARPGLNIFEDKFEPYYIVGLRASWTPFEWGKNGIEKQTIETQKALIDIQKDNLTDNLNILSVKYKNAYYQNEEALKADDEIISLKIRIFEQTESLYKHGSVTSSEYLEAFNDVARAKLDKEIRIIRMTKAWFDFITVTNNMSRDYQ